MDPWNAGHLERALQLMCLVVTHGWRGGNLEEQLQVRQLVPSTASPDGFQELPYTFRADGDAAYLYGPASWTAHSCTPNAWATVMCPKAELCLIARRTIRAGDVITVSLVDDALIVTESRQRLLQQLCGFDCQCELCSGLCLSTMCASPVGQCAACGFKLIEQRSGLWQCGACGVRLQQSQQASFTSQISAASADLAVELRELQALVFAEAPGATPSYSSLRRLRRFAAEAATSVGACHSWVSMCGHMLATLYVDVGSNAADAADGKLPRTRATRGWPADAPRDSVTLYVLAAECALDSIRISECAAAQCTDCGGAKCTSEHPLLGGSALLRAREASAALLQAVAAARGVAVGEGPVITLTELRGVLVQTASLAEPTADVLLSHLRRYAPVLQLHLGPQDAYLLEVAVMLQAPLRCAEVPLLWCAKCGCVQATMPTGEFLRSCRRCACVRYCNKACQTEHWRGGHKRLCAALAELRTLQLSNEG
jgi:MYND finger